MGLPAEKLKTKKKTTKPKRVECCFPPRRGQASQVTRYHREHGFILQDHIHQFYPKCGEWVQSQPGSKSPRKS